MYDKTIPLYLLCESALHAGSVNDLGDIDLPIQREKHTGFPKVESSSLKGAIRQAFETKIGQNGFKNLEADDVKLHRIFGLDTGDLAETDKESLLKQLKDKERDNADFASAVGFSDARLLLFPVRSMKGIFAWITCPRVLKKFRYELDSICNPRWTNTWEIPEENTITTNCELFSQPGKIQLDEYLYDDFDKDQRNCDDLAAWIKEVVFAKAPKYWQDKILTSLVVLSDEDFSSFVSFSTEVITRIKINGNTGTVEQGGLFTEEYLPSEAVLYSLAMFSNEFRVGESMTAEDVVGFFKKLPAYFQMGGNATLGKGIVSTNFSNQKTKDNE